MKKLVRWASFFSIFINTLFSGRSLEAKRHLYQEIVQRFEALGIQPSDVFIVLNEQPIDNWGIRGGVPASEVDLGFDVKV